MGRNVLFSTLAFTIAGLCFCSVRLNGQAAPGNGGRVQIFRTRLTQAKDVQGLDYDVFAETQNADNADNPALWQFDVSPMFIPKRLEAPASGVAFETQVLSKVKVPVSGGHRWDVTTRLVIELVVKSKEQTLKALRAVNEVYAEKKITFKEEQINTEPVIQVVVSMPDLIGHSGCKLVNPTIPLAGNEQTVPLMFDCLDQLQSENAATSSVEAFKNQLHFKVATIAITFDAKEAERASASLTSSDVRSSAFYSNLSGLGSEVYVTRADLNQLSIQASRQLSIMFKGKKMAADDLQTCVNAQVLSTEKTIDRDQVTTATLQRTYNSKDLDPTEVDKEVKEVNDKGSTKDNVKGSYAGGVGIAGDLFKADTTVSGEKYSEWMKEHGEKVEWDGKRWVAKGLDVYQVNTTTLADQISKSCTFETYDAGVPAAVQTRALRF